MPEAAQELHDPASDEEDGGNAAATTTSAVSASEALTEGADGSGKKKASRTTLSVYEKSVVKTYCEQRLADSKAHEAVVPSQDVLRQEIVLKFGWELGRSTLSKIMSLDWQQLQLTNCANPNMKRKRKPRFPSFEADLVKALRTIEMQQVVSTMKNGMIQGGGLLTEAMILEEAQRLKQQHNIKDDELVLSVGWLARFKQRNGIQLRKGNGSRSTPNQPGHFGLASLGASLAASVADMPNQAHMDATTNPRLAAPRVSSVMRNEQHEGNNSAHSLIQAFDALSALTKEKSLCASIWHDTRKQDPHLEQAILRIPTLVRVFACGGCEPALFAGIEGLAVAIIGFNCVRDAFLAGAFAGPQGSVTCIEANPSAIAAADPLVAEYATKTLAYAASNIQLHLSSSLLAQSIFPRLVGTMDVVLLDCSFLTFPNKSALLEIAFALLRPGGECRLAALTSSRRVTNAESIPEAPAPSLVCQLTHSAMYHEDLRRMCQDAGFLVQRRLDTFKTWPDPEHVRAPIGLTFKRFRLFKLEQAEDQQEDYGEQATYRGGLAAQDTMTRDDDVYRLDHEFEFRKDQPTHIDGNTAQILRTSWLKRYFDVEGDRSTHRGRFMAAM